MAHFVVRLSISVAVPMQKPQEHRRINIPRMAAFQHVALIAIFNRLVLRCVLEYQIVSTVMRTHTYTIATIFTSIHRSATPSVHTIGLITGKVRVMRVEHALVVKGNASLTSSIPNWSSVRQKTFIVVRPPLMDQVTANRRDQAA